MKGSYLSATLVAMTCLILSYNGCLRPSEGRAELDLLVGFASVEGVNLEVEGGLAAVRRAVPGELVLWSSSPVMDLRLEAEAGVEAQPWTLTMRNCMPDAVMTVVDAQGEPLPDQAQEVVRALSRGAVPTRRSWTIQVEPGQSLRLHVAPPDEKEGTPFRFGLLNDVQNHIFEVEDIYLRMNEEPDLRFVLSSGDLTEQGTQEELMEFQSKMESFLKVPLYATTGNHEMGTEGEVWHQIWGRFNSFFVFKDIAFTMVDSGHATLDPLVYEWLDGWLARHKERVHVFGTHLTPLDPVGTRNGAFRSRKEAGKLITMMGRAKVDMTFYGHIHSYYAFSLAGIPSYVTGGGGAIPERLDGVGRHFLVVDATPGQRVDRVGLVRVD